MEFRRVLFRSLPSKLPTHSLRFSQKVSLSLSFAPTTGAYAQIKTQYSLLNLNLTQTILAPILPLPFTQLHHSSLITIATPSLALTLSFTPAYIPLYFPNAKSPSPFNFVSVNAKISNLLSSITTPTSSLFSSLFTPLTFRVPTFNTSEPPFLPDISTIYIQSLPNCDVSRWDPLPKDTTSS